MTSNLLILLGLAAFAFSTTAGDCPSEYQKFSSKHTYCLPPNRDCNILDKGVTSTQANDIVRIHNELRSRIAMGKENRGNQPPASNMLQMVWNRELAAVAQKHVEQCKFNHDCYECRRTREFSLVGQNIYTRWTSQTTPLPKPNWEAAINSWYSEVKDFSNSLVNSFQTGTTPAMIGHYTQVVWATTWQVGCGHTTYPKNGGMTELYTCNYGPAGNMLRDKVYKTGEACKGCPGNTSCSKDYSGLCKVANGKTPA